jgi:DNA polymerase-1
MAPTGAAKPLVYVLGEAPGGDEDKEGRQFVGRAGRVLRSRIPDDWIDQIRFNNCVRTRPPKNRTPAYVEIEACRPSIIRDIEATKPFAIFGFGNVPLHWAIGQNGITKWRGRWLPIKVGKHVCWYFPMLHPSYIARKKQDKDRDANDFEFVFELDLKRAFELVERLPDPVVHSREDAFKDVNFVTGRNPGDKEIVLEFIDSLYDEKLVGLDYETNGVRPYKPGAKILTVALSSSRETLAFPLRHKQAKWTEDELEDIERAFEDFLFNAPCKKTVHQLSFEMEWSAFFYGKDVCRAQPWEDSVTQCFVLDERFKMGSPDANSLEFLCIQYFGINVKALSNLDRNNLDDKKLEDVLIYNGVDAKYHRALYLKQAKRLKEEGLWEVYRERLEYIATMVLTQLQGLPVSRSAVEHFYDFYTDRIKAAEKKIFAHPDTERFNKKFGRMFRPSANADVKKLVTRVLGLPLEKTDEDALKAVDHPLAALILQHRKDSKIRVTYVEPCREGSPHLFEGKIHPIISTNRTRTGRSASEDPNIQNWPKRDEEQKEVRGQIKPRKGPRGARKIVSFDYGQIQARNVAMESKDEALVKAFWDEYDIHMDLAEYVVEIYPAWAAEGVKKFATDKKYRKKLRNEAKNDVVFPWFFGAQPTSISKYLHVPMDTATEVWEFLNEQFPGVAAWQADLRAMYKKHGYVEGLTGFRRRAPISPNQLINSPIQADEAHIVLDAMTRLSKAGEQASMEIHDDLTFIWYQSEIEKRAEFVIDTMLNCPFPWAKNVPIVVEMAVGEDWYELKDVGAYSSATWNGNIRSDKADVQLIGTWADGTGWADKEYSEGRAFSHPRRRGKR